MDDLDLETDENKLSRWLQNSIKKVIEEWQEEAGIAKHHLIGLTFDSFKRDLQQKAFEAVKSLDVNRSQLQFPNSLILTGSYGLGKTHLCVAKVNEVIETSEKAAIENDRWSGKTIKEYHDSPVRMITESILLGEVKDTFSVRRDPKDRTYDIDMDFGHGKPKRKLKGLTTDEYYQLLADYRLLIIDDVGKISLNDKAFLQGIFFEVIDRRYKEEKATIVTTNLDLTELEAHIGGACADRLLEMCGKRGIVNLTGKSYRKMLATEEVQREG